MSSPERPAEHDRWAESPEIKAANIRNPARRDGAGHPKSRLDRPDFAAEARLAELLSEIRLIAASVAEFSLAAGRGIVVEDASHFFVVLEGECWLHEPGRDPVQLKPGDSVLTLRGGPARLATGPMCDDFTAIVDVWRGSGSPPLELRGFDMPLRLTCGEGPAACRLVGCAMIFSRSTRQSILIRQAPPLLLLTAEESGLGDIAVAIRNGLRRADRGRYGIASTAFGQFLLIEQLKAYIDRDRATFAASIGTGGAHNIWKLVDLLRKDPTRPWNLATMAREAAMSRTSFVQTFGEMMGTTPARFLALCRVDQGAGLLRATRLSVEEAAHLSGYASERAFRAAFLQEFGMTPGAFRDSRRNPFETRA